MERKAAHPDKHRRPQCLDQLELRNLTDRNCPPRPRPFPRRTFWRCAPRPGRPDARRAERRCGRGRRVRCRCMGTSGPMTARRNADRPRCADRKPAGRSIRRNANTRRSDHWGRRRKLPAVPRARTCAAYPCRGWESSAIPPDRRARSRSIPASLSRYQGTVLASANAFFFRSLCMCAICARNSGNGRGRLISRALVLLRRISCLKISIDQFRLHDFPGRRHRHI